MPFEDVTLTKTQRNAVFNWLTVAKFDPADFEWTEQELNEDSRLGVVRSRGSTLVHRRTRYYFNFGRIYCRFVPGVKSKVEAQEHLNDWTMRAGSFKLWLLCLRQEVDAPDLWASIGQEKVLSTAASSASLDNRPFTAAEQNLIAAKLDEIKGYLLEGQQFAAEEAEFVEQRFAYFKESSTRMGRKDWLNNLLGGLVGLAIGLALDPEKTRGLLRLAGVVFQSLWGMALGYLP